MKQEKWITFLRWLIFVPGSAIGSWAAWWIFYYGSRKVLLMVNINPDTVDNKFFRQVLGSGILGATFVYLGLRIAPDNRKLATFIMAGLVIFIVGGAAFFAIMRINLPSLIEVITMTIGAGCIFFLNQKVQNQKTDTSSFGSATDNS